MECIQSGPSLKKVVPALDAFKMLALWLAELFAAIVSIWLIIESYRQFSGGNQVAGLMAIAGCCLLMVFCLLINHFVGENNSKQ